MRVLLFLVILFVSSASFTQRKKKQATIPQTLEDSLKLETALIHAEKFLIIEDYTKALKKFHLALEMNPQNAVTHFKIAEILTKDDKSQEAIPYGLTAIELDPTNKYYRLELARTYQSIGFYIEAAKIYENMLDFFPSEENALYELAELYQLTGKKEEMFKTFDRIETQLGVKEDIIREKQRIYKRENKLDKIADEYKKLIDAYPHEPAYKIEYIHFLIRNKKLDMAEEAITNYEMTGYASSRIMLMKSELAWMEGDYDKSLELFSKVFHANSITFDSKFQIISNYLISSPSSENRKKLTKMTVQLAHQYPDEFKAHAFVGDLLFQDGKEQEAVESYLQAVTLDPSHFAVWRNILNVEANLNQYDSVTVHSERALEYFPNHALLYYFAGTGHLLKKNYKKSVQMLEQGRKYSVDPSLLTILYGQLGDAYTELNDSEKSFNAYDKALENNATNGHVLNNYSYFLSLANKNLDKALKMSTKLIKLHPNNPTYLDTHGWVLYTVGKFKESKKFLEKASSMEDDGTVIEHYGDVLFQLGEVQEAIIQWEKARSIGGASDLIEKKIIDQRLYE